MISESARDRKIERTGIDVGIACGLGLTVGDVACITAADATGFVAVVFRRVIGQIAGHQRDRHTDIFAQPETLEQRRIEREGVFQPFLCDECGECFGRRARLSCDALRSAQGFRFYVATADIARREPESPAFRSEIACSDAGCRLRYVSGAAITHVALRIGVDRRLIIACVPLS